MDSMLSGMKKAAAVLQTTARGSGDLGMVIYHQKEVAESWTKVAQATLQATKAYTTWGKTEGEAMMQFFEHQNQIDAIFIKQIEDMVKKYDYNRRCYKEILKGEKTLEELTEKKKECETKLTKTTKQYEGSRKGKQKTLEVELTKAKAMLGQANDELDRHARNHARFKFQKLAEAYKDHAAIHLKFHDDARKVARAQMQLNQVYLQENFTTFTVPKLHAAEVEAQTVLNNLTEALNNSKIDSLQGSFRSNNSSEEWPGDFDEDYMDHPEREIQDAPDMGMNANRPLPAVPVYDNNPIQPGEYLDMDYAEYEPYIEGNAQVRSDQYLNVYEPLNQAKEPAAKSLGDLMEEVKLENRDSRYLSMKGSGQDTQSPGRAEPNPYGPAPGQTIPQSGQLYPNVNPDNSPPDGAEFLPPPPPEFLNKDEAASYGPHDFV